MDDECDAVLAELKAKRGEPGDTLFREGDPGDSLMLVLDGELITYVDVDGTLEEVSRITSGQTLGELAFIDAEPRSATVVSQTGAVVFEFTREGMASLRKSAPRVAVAIYRNLLTDVANRLRHLATLLPAGSTPRTHYVGEPATGGRQLSVMQLQMIPSLASYSDDDLKMLSYVSTSHLFAQDEALMEEGEMGNACWLLLTGSVVVTRESQATPLAMLGPGAMVGQLALLDQSPRSATVKATAESSALELRETAFKELMNSHTPFAIRFQEQVALAGVRQLRVATNRFTQMSTARKIANLGHDIVDWADLASPFES
jgi:CRP/FNR family cyclic AMP-dependent transcriptional regulator